MAGILLVALALLQGCLLYFAGSNDTIWLLYIAGGYALFLIAGVLAPFGGGAAVVTLISLIVIGALLPQRAIPPIKKRYVDLVPFLSKYPPTPHPTDPNT